MNVSNTPSNVSVFLGDIPPNPNTQIRNILSHSNLTKEKKPPIVHYDLGSIFDNNPKLQKIPNVNSLIKALETDESGTIAYELAMLLYKANPFGYIGKGAHNNSVTGVIKLLQASLQSNPNNDKASYALSLLYFYGIATEPSIPKAKDYLLSSAKQGNPNAQFELAQIILSLVENNKPFYEEKSLENNQGIALKYLQAAAQQNHTGALCLLAHILIKPASVSINSITTDNQITLQNAQDYIQALEYYQSVVTVKQPSNSSFHEVYQAHASFKIIDIISKLSNLSFDDDDDKNFDVEEQQEITDYCSTTINQAHQDNVFSQYFDKDSLKTNAVELAKEVLKAQLIAYTQTAQNHSNFNFISPLATNIFLEAEIQKLPISEDTTGEPILGYFETGTYIKIISNIIIKEDDYRPRNIKISENQQQLLLSALQNPDVIKALTLMAENPEVINIMICSCQEEIQTKQAINKQMNIIKQTPELQTYFLQTYIAIKGMLDFVAVQQGLGKHTLQTSSSIMDNLTNAQSVCTLVSEVIKLAGQEISIPGVAIITAAFSQYLGYVAEIDLKQQTNIINHLIGSSSPTDIGKFTHTLARALTLVNQEQIIKLANQPPSQIRDFFQKFPDLHTKFLQNIKAIKDIPQEDYVTHTQKALSSSNAYKALIILAKAKQNQPIDVTDNYLLSLLTKEFPSTQIIWGQLELNNTNNIIIPSISLTKAINISFPTHQIQSLLNQNLSYTQIENITRAFLLTKFGILVTNGKFTTDAKTYNLRELLKHDRPIVDRILSPTQHTSYTIEKDIQSFLEKCGLSNGYTEENQQFLAQQVQNLP